jgi:hypothetical protein
MILLKTIDTDSTARIQLPNITFPAHLDTFGFLLRIHVTTMPAAPKTATIWTCCVCGRNNDPRYHPYGCTNPACEPHARCQGCTEEVIVFERKKKGKK